MADDHSVVIKFGAETDGVLDGIDQVRSAIASFRDQVGDLDGRLDGLGASFESALPIDQINQAAKAVSDIGSAARNAAGSVSSVGAQLRLLHISQGEQRTLLNADVSQFKITQDQKFALLQAELSKEYSAEQQLLYQKLGAAEFYSDQWKHIRDQMQVLAAKYDADLLRLNEQSIAAQQAQWTGYLSTVTGAFNSQLRGLLEGTTTWHKATIKMLEDLTIKFIETAEQMVLKSLADEIAQTAATQVGAAALTVANETAANSGVLAGEASAVRTDLTDAPQAFAG